MVRLRAFSTIRTILESGQMPPELEKEPKIGGDSQPEEAQGRSALDLETVRVAFSPDVLQIKPIVPEVLETSANILDAILLKLKDIIKTYTEVPTKSWTMHKARNFVDIPLYSARRKIVKFAFLDIKPCKSQSPQYIPQ